MTPIRKYLFSQRATAVMIVEEIATTRDAHTAESKDIFKENVKNTEEKRTSSIVCIAI